MKCHLIISFAGIKSFEIKSLFGSLGVLIAKSVGRFSYFYVLLCRVFVYLSFNSFQTGVVCLKPCGYLNMFNACLISRNDDTGMDSKLRPPAEIQCPMRHEVWTYKSSTPCSLNRLKLVIFKTFVSGPFYEMEISMRQASL